MEMEARAQESTLRFFTRGIFSSEEFFFLNGKVATLHDTCTQINLGKDRERGK